jgi:NAD-dependent DNA ligase
MYNTYMNQEVNTVFIEEPTQCPSCNYPLEKVGDQLFCRSISCSAQLAKKLEHFAKVLGIKGLGPKTIEKLNLQELTEIFYLDLQEVSEVLGVKVAAKLLDEIKRAEGANLATVLESFSIPLFGNTAAKKLCIVVSSIEEITQETCKLAGLGEKVTDNLLNWLNTEYKEIEEFLPFTFDKPVKHIDINAKRVCITGKLKQYKKKADAESILAAAGYILVDSVTKQTDFLVDEGDSMSSKKEKAIQYGITIITDLNDLLKETKINV